MANETTSSRNNSSRDKRPPRGLLIGEKCGPTGEIPLLSREATLHAIRRSRVWATWGP